MQQEQGPILDGIRELLAHVVAWLTALVDLVKSIPGLIDSRIDRLENKFLIVLAVIGVVFVGTMVLTRRK